MDINCLRRTDAIYELSLSYAVLKKNSSNEDCCDVFRSTAIICSTVLVEVGCSVIADMLSPRKINLITITSLCLMHLIILLHLYIADYSLVP